jgi:hypothetical protein
MAHTLTLEVPEKVYVPLVKAAQQTGKTPEEMAVQYLTSVVTRFDDDPLEKFIGAFDSGVADWADRHDEYIGKALAQASSLCEIAG